MINLKKYKSIIIIIIVICILFLCFIDNKIIERFDSCIIDSIMPTVTSSNFTQYNNNGYTSSSSSNMQFFTVKDMSNTIFSDISYTVINSNDPINDCLICGDSLGYDIIATNNPRYNNTSNIVNCKMYKINDNITGTSADKYLYYISDGANNYNYDNIENIDNVYTQATNNNQLLTMTGYNKLNSDNFNRIKNLNIYCIDDFFTQKYKNSLDECLSDTSYNNDIDHLQECLKNNNRIIEGYTSATDYIDDICNNYTNVWSNPSISSEFVTSTDSKLEYDDLNNSNYINYFFDNLLEKTKQNNKTSNDKYNNDISSNISARQQIEYTNTSYISNVYIYMFLFIIFLIGSIILVLHYFSPEIVTTEILISVVIFIAVVLFIGIKYFNLNIKSMF